MTIYTNVHQVPRVTGLASGALYIDRQEVSLADDNAWPSAVALGDQIQIGVVPAGCVLVPWLSNLNLPVLDSGPSGTLSVSVGTQATPAALKATATAIAPANVAGSTLAPGVVIGSNLTNTPIFITATAAAVAAAQTGTIVFDLALRPWVDRFDAGNTVA